LVFLVWKQTIWQPCFEAIELSMGGSRVAR
jgi:hypothetical protein